MDEIQSRKDRLKALRHAAIDADNGSNIPTSEENTSESPNIILKFRNYDVKDKQIEHEKVPITNPPDFKEPEADIKPYDQSQDVNELMQGMGPKKANLDLKRDIQASLEKLERRTQRAILEVMREQQNQ
uniref:Uncharacterized protein n=1 Tax=Polytomella parva TaxID=51329 RepID=A0A7S0YC11_9CHLO